MTDKRQNYPELSDDSSTLCGVDQGVEGLSLLKHLHRYMVEYGFRYSNRIRLGCDDKERANRALLSLVGKRLTYQRTGI